MKMVVVYAPCVERGCPHHLVTTISSIILLISITVSIVRPVGH